MPRIVAFTLLAMTLHGQDSVKPVEKAPARVDQALRARVTQFYQDFVTGQFTDAEALVAPETKNYFLSIKKERYLSCELKSIDYSGKFTLAQVSSVCERNVVFEGFAGHPLKYPIGSQWKLEKGKWYWYMDPNTPQVTPFGIMGTIMGAMASAAPAGSPAPAAALPSPAALTSPEVAFHKVSADKQSLDLKAGESAAITFSNAALGPMGVTLSGDPPQGFEVTPTHADLQQSGKAAITVKALEGAKSATLNFQVFPTSEVISVTVAIH
jgi:hypothetical protein